MCNQQYYYLLYSFIYEIFTVLPQYFTENIEPFTFIYVHSVAYGVLSVLQCRAEPNSGLAQK